MKNISRFTLIACAVLPVGVLVVFLVIQNHRQGWPFSQSESGRSPLVHSISPVADRGNTQNAAAARKAIELPANQVESLGVQIEPVGLGVFNDPVHAVATVSVDESRVTHIHTRVAGWLEALYVNTTGQQVRAGQTIGAVFSQELYSSQSEYLSAWRRAASGPASVVLESARTRLKLLGMSDAEIANMEATGTVHRLVTITAPKGGIVLNRGVTEGAAIDPSTDILTLADLSQVWVIAEVAESDAARIGVGTMAMLTFPASGRESISARVSYIYPTLTEGTRTVRVRLSVPNVGGALRPGLFGSAEFTGVSRDALTVKRDAVVDTGMTQHVFVQTSPNVFEPRVVKVGAQLADRVEILQGLKVGERVVTSGVFLIDSESRLRASGGAGHSGHGGSPSDQKGAATPPAVSGQHQEHPQ